MKIKKGYTWKSIEGPAKGKMFIVVHVLADSIIYRSLESYREYEMPRKQFDKYIERVNKYWHDKNTAYKRKKENLKREQ